MISLIIKDDSPLERLSELLDELHHNGPDSQAVLEKLSLYKKFHPDAFSEVEEKVLSSMGLFYKIDDPQSLYSLLLRNFSGPVSKNNGKFFTPVQSSVRNAITNNQFISISAPTSAGKSYSIRDFIANSDGDAVIVVPSRALIAEYINVMRRTFHDNKNVMIMSFVDKVFTNRQLRRIFILTPERARDLFDSNLGINPKVFFFDEAQMSEEKGRGVFFDVLIRRVIKAFPSAKLIFAHPFVDNPSAQFSKHNLSGDHCFSKAYPYGAVGKIFIHKHKNQKDYIFSPFITGGHLIKKSHEFGESFGDFAFSEKRSILVYVTKASIYSGKFLDDFVNYIEQFEEINDPVAISIINAIEKIVGANQSTHKSKLIELLKKGVVIHHGSVPLEVRFLIEDFVRNGYARLCFATSTLVQGINMPFDILWLSTMRTLGDDDKSKSLAFKNLIGRAGRSSQERKFDFGYVYTQNPTSLIKKVNEDYLLSESSIIESDSEGLDSDISEVLQSIRDGSFDDDLHVPKSKVDRISRDEILDVLISALDCIYGSSDSIQNLSGPDNAERRMRFEKCLVAVYEASINRSLLAGEAAVFKEAVSLMLQKFQGRSFREIVGLRYSRISNRDNPSEIYSSFTQRANKLPDSSLVNSFPLIPKKTKKNQVSYDAVVFDTYDYLDQVISFCLADVFVAAFKVLYQKSGDSRALKFIELLRFNTNNPDHVLLLRYGFLPEDVELVSKYLVKINESEVVFRDIGSIDDERVKKIISWYV